MSSTYKLQLILILLFSASWPTFSQTIESGNRQLRLIELYTSEGCSSCPPADQWLSQLVAHPQLWKEFVALAFHVDYWNDLGWPDKFSKPEFSQRQRNYQRQGSTASVYTPGFLIQGKEWRAWFGNQAFPDANDREVGNLSITGTGNGFRVQFKSTQDLGRAVLHFAWLGFGLKRHISAGENAGKVLQQDFVVLTHASRITDSKDNLHTGEFNLAKPENHNAEKLAVVAWVSPTGLQYPIQTAGGWYWD